MHVPIGCSLLCCPGVAGCRRLRAASTTRRLHRGRGRLMLWQRCLTHSSALGLMWLGSRWPRVDAYAEVITTPPLATARALCRLSSTGRLDAAVAVAALGSWFLWSEAQSGPRRRPTKSQVTPASFLRLVGASGRQSWQRCQLVALLARMSPMLCALAHVLAHAATAESGDPA